MKVLQITFDPNVLFNTGKVRVKGTIDGFFESPDCVGILLEMEVEQSDIIPMLKVFGKNFRHALVTINTND